MRGTAVATRWRGAGGPCAGPHSPQGVPNGHERCRVGTDRSFEGFTSAASLAGSSFGRLPRGFGNPYRPAHDSVLEILVRDLVLGGADAPAHRDAGLVDRLRVAGY